METSPAPALDTGPVKAAPSGCPLAHSSDQPALAPPPVARSRPDQVVRALLRIPERSPGVSVRDAHSAFQRSMAISATRCTMTYLVFPIVIPLIGLGVGVGPALGVVIGTVALVCDAFAIRRFFAVDHRWRWQFAGLITVVMLFLAVLLVEDFTHLA